MRGLSSALLLTLLACPSPTPPAPVDAGPVALPCVQIRTVMTQSVVRKMVSAKSFRPAAKTANVPGMVYLSACRTRDGFGNET